MTLFPSSDKYKHVVRENGTIRVCTKAAVGVEDGETVFLSKLFHQPGEWFFDFARKEMVAYTPAQLAERRRARQAAERADKRGRDEKLRRLGQVLAKQSPEVREALELIAELSGVQAKKEPEEAPDTSRE